MKPQTWSLFLHYCNLQHHSKFQIDFLVVAWISVLLNVLYTVFSKVDNIHQRSWPSPLTTALLLRQMWHVRLESTEVLLSIKPKNVKVELKVLLPLSIAFLNGADTAPGVQRRWKQDFWKGHLRFNTKDPVKILFKEKNNKLISAWRTRRKLHCCIA